MAKKPNVRTVLNYKALRGFALGIADGMADLGEAFLDTVDPPDATPFGKGLVTTPDYGVWSNGKKVAGGATKPRSVRVRAVGAVLIAGEGFPGRFQELGTVKMSSNPHVTPAMLTVLPNAGPFIKAGVRKRLRSIR